MLGAMLGDAFGRPLEGTALGDSRLPRWVERRRESADPLGYSDDTEMMIFVAESLIECGRVDPDHLLRWMATHHDPARGYGKGTRSAFTAAMSGVPTSEASRSFWAEGSKGNGAAVRVAPIACVYSRNDSTLAPAAAASARITHGHESAVAAAVVMARAIAAALETDPRRIPDAGWFVSSLAGWDSTLDAKLRLVVGLVGERASTADVVAALGNGVLAVESVPLALFNFLRWGDDYEGAVVQTALCGGDVDSICSMTGALAGALDGEEALPARWLARAEDRRRGLRFVSALADRISDLGCPSRTQL
jgi:poly(ADP-ribose) glycohydrolase ARH3